MFENRNRLSRDGDGLRALPTLIQSANTLPVWHPDFKETSPAPRRLSRRRLSDVTNGLSDQGLTGLARKETPLSVPGRQRIRSVILEEGGDLKGNSGRMARPSFLDGLFYDENDEGSPTESCQNSPHPSPRGSKSYGAEGFTDYFRLKPKQRKSMLFTAVV